MKDLKKINIKSAIAFTGGFFVFLFIVLSVFRETQIIKTKQASISVIENNPLYQYSAPWDAKLYENFYTNLPSRENREQIIKGGIVPHHLVGGHIAAEFFNALPEQAPSTIVLIGPNHFSRGSSSIITSELDWKTPFGITSANKKIIRSLQDEKFIQKKEEIIAEEHSIYSIIPFIKKSLPETEIVPIILKNTVGENEMNALVELLIKNTPRDAVFVSSIDFSHYQISHASDFHDELSANVIATGDISRLSKLEIDSTPSLYVLMKLMKYYKTEYVFYSMRDSSANLMRNHTKRDTTSYYSPWFASGQPLLSKDSAISILHFGDMMLDRNVAKHIGSNGADSIFSKLAGEESRFFQGVDLISANLEGPFGDKRRATTKSIAFNFNPDLIKILKKYNFGLFTLANNHSYDMGREAFVETKKNLRDANIEFYGEQYSVDDDALFIKDIAGKKIAFIGLNDTNNPIEWEVMAPLINRAEQEADFTVLNIHWGAEYQLTSHPRQRELAHKSIDIGVDLIIGHHSHVVQEIEIYKDRPIFYSLGNFVFDQYFSEPTQQGLAVGTVFYPNKISIYLFPLEGQKSEVDLMSNERAFGMIERILPKVYNDLVNPFHFEVIFDKDQNN